MCRTKEWGWRVALILFRAIHPCLNIKISYLAGAEGELQLRPLLSAGEWKSWEIPGWGTPPRRLSIQWTCRILGGKERRSLLIFLFLSSLFSRSESFSHSIMPIPLVFITIQGCLFHSHDYIVGINAWQRLPVLVAEGLSSFLACTLKLSADPLHAW